MNQNVCETASRISLHTIPSRFLPGLISLSMLSLITSVSVSLPWLLRHSIIRYYQSVSCCQGTSNCTFHPLYKKNLRICSSLQHPALLSFPTLSPYPAPHRLVSSLLVSITLVLQHLCLYSGFEQRWPIFFINPRFAIQLLAQTTVVSILTSFPLPKRK